MMTVTAMPVESPMPKWVTCPAGEFVGHDDAGSDEDQQEGADELGGKGFKGDMSWT